MILNLVISSFMGSFLLWAILVFDLLLKISGNAEGDALNVLKNNLADPNNVLQSWDPTQATPCMWFRVTCNSDNRVTRVDLGDENLSGQLVPQLGQLPNLQYLELYGNNISGKIPDELGNLTNLVSLDLYLNGLTGPIPHTLGNLKKLHFLRLNNNSLSGNIPMSLFTVASLQVLDLSNNLLIGDVLIHGSFSSIASISFQNNPGLKQQTFPPPSGISPMPKAPSGNSATAVIVGVAAGAALSFAAPAIAIAYWRRRKQDLFFDVPAAEPEVHHHGLSLAAVKPEVHPQVKQFSLHELKSATDNFSNKNLVGEGGFGVVYKGCLADGSLVAVKRLGGESFTMEQELRREVKIISMAVHRNLLRLRGFYMTSTELLLVYPFMVNGDLDSWFRGRPRLPSLLDWSIRKRIALGAARGLAYLHSHCDSKIIHCDVKPANILLDEGFEAVIGDFSLVRFADLNDSHDSTSCVRGTYGYIAPEYYLEGKVSDKNDVYGYGVILLVLISGQPSIYRLEQLAVHSGSIIYERPDKLYNWLCIHWVKGLLEDKKLETLVDAKLQGNYNEEEVERLAQVFLLCTQYDPWRRPRMSEVVGMLEGDDFSAKWEQFLQNEEVLRQDRGPTANWIEDSASDLSPDELSGPR